MNKQQKLNIIREFLANPKINKTDVARDLWGRDKSQSWLSSTLRQKIRGMDENSHETTNKQYWWDWEIDRLLEIREKLKNEL